jgi:hypothetical protein
MRSVGKSERLSDKFLHRSIFGQLVEDQMFRLRTRKLDVRKLVNKGFSWNLVFFSQVPTRIQQIDLDTNLDSYVDNSKAQFKRWLLAESVFFKRYLKTRL